MRAKHGFRVAVLTVLLAGPSIQAQSPLELPYLNEYPRLEATPERPAVAPVPAALSVGQPSPQAAMSDSWIYQRDPHCCGPIGGDGPIGGELYLRGGPNIILGGSHFARALRPGIELMGGGKSLFFTPEGDRAWIVDLGVSFTENGGRGEETFDLNGQQVRLRKLDRTAVSLGLGHDWFVKGPGFVGGSWDPNFRFGIDGGARWGTAHVNLTTTDGLNSFFREQSVYGAAFAALHFDVEVPVGAWTLLAGVRGEWSYSFMDPLPGMNVHLQDLNLLLTIGARY